MMSKVKKNFRASECLTQDKMAIRKTEASGWPSGIDRLKKIITGIDPITYLESL